MKKKWIKVDPKYFAINQVNGRIVEGDDKFMVWGLGKTTGWGTTWADFVKRENGYEVGIGRKGKGGKGWWKETHANRDDALKSLIKEMKKRGVVKF